MFTLLSEFNVRRIRELRLPSYIKQKPKNENIILYFFIFYFLKLSAGSGFKLDIYSTY